MSQVLSGLVREIPAPAEDPLAWARMQWDLVVGRDLAQVTRLRRITAKTLYVDVAGPEWLAPLKTLEPRLLASMKPRLGAFSRLVCRVVDSPEPAPAPQPAGPPETPAAAAESRDDAPDVKGLQMIQDAHLRNTLGRIARRLQFGAAFLGLSFLMVSCSGLPTVGGMGLPEPVPLKDSYAVKRIQELKAKGHTSVRDPRAYYHFLQSLKYEREGDFDRATDHYIQVVANDPERENFNLHLAVLLLRTGRITEAQDHARKALVRFPKNTRIRMILADILAVQGKHEEALAEYRRILDQDPKSSRAQLMLANILETQGKWDEALAAYRQVTVMDPHNPLGFFYLGRAQALKGKYAEAEKSLTKALSLRPSLLDARKFLGLSLDQQGKFTKSLEQYLILHKLMAHKDLGEHIDRIKQKKRIADEGGDPGKIPTLEIETVPIHALLGAVYYEQASYLEAIDEFRLALVQEDDLEIRWIIAKIYELLGRVDKAIQEIEAYKAPVSEGEKVEVLLNLARLYGLNQQMDKSVELLKAALKYEPRNDRLFHSLALAHMALSEYDEAITTIQKAIELDDQKDAYFFELGAMYERKGDFQRAIEAMERVLALNPNHSNAHNFIGYLYAQQGTNLDQAIVHLEKALSIQPRNGYFLDSLGWIYYKKGNLQEALRQIKKAMMYVPPDPVLYDHLGEVLFSLRNFQEAHRAWKTSLALTLKKLDDPTGELPDPEKLREKIRRTRDMMKQPKL